MEPKNPTLEDVAKAAGVSTATVSRCLNRTGTVSEKTRARVMETVEALGYTPNFVAQALAANRTGTIGAIIPTMENAIFARGLQTFQERLNDRGYTLLVSSTAYRPELEAEQIRALAARGADGLLLIGYERDARVYDYLAQRKLPFLLSWAQQPASPYPAIGFDNRAAMRALTQTVLEAGHRHIGILSGLMKGNDRASERVAGIRAALDAAGILATHAPLLEVPYGIREGGAAFEELRGSAPEVTAVMCINDVLAVGALRRAQEMGLGVPDDISITGFDDIEIARVVSPQLTTVHVPHGRMGSLAADELVRMVEEKAPGRSTALESTLCLRASLGAPPKSRP